MFDIKALSRKRKKKRQETEYHAISAMRKSAAEVASIQLYFMILHALQRDWTSLKRATQ
jgi:hypothetical protein